MKFTENTTLTEIEVRGLARDLSLADGHADYQSTALSSVDLADVWKRATSVKLKSAESEYLQYYSELNSMPVVFDDTELAVFCPSASNAIDILGAWLANSKLKTALITPTFDNLYYLLNRRGVNVVPVSEDMIFSADSDHLTGILKDQGIQCLFIVNPNNPSGRVLSQYNIQEIAKACVATDCIVAIDASFRSFSRCGGLDIRLFNELGVKIISIEDTGKAWPTLELKVGLLWSNVPNIADGLRHIYEEIYLGWSRFTLLLFAELYKRVIENGGLKKHIWQKVDEGRILVRKLIHPYITEVNMPFADSNISVEWIKIPYENVSDYQLCAELDRLGLSVLPGRHFYWHAPDDPIHHQFFRLSLMKEPIKLASACELIETYFSSIRSEDKKCVEL